MRRIGSMLGLIALLLPLAVSAHGSGVTLSQEVDGRFIDVDYELPAIIADDTGRFDFKLFTDSSRTKPVDFTQVWVRIVRKSDIPEGDTIFSGPVPRPSFGTTGFSISLPSSGEYSVLTRFYKGDEEIVEATLPFTVGPSTDENTIVFNRNLLFGFLCGLVVSAALACGVYLRRAR